MNIDYRHRGRSVRLQAGMLPGEMCVGCRDYIYKLCVVVAAGGPIVGVAPLCEGWMRWGSPEGSQAGTFNQSLAPAAHGHGDTGRL